MSDGLKDFIRNNREGFDDLEPGDLWSGIDSAVQQHNSWFNPKNITNMLKYGFGASALIAGTLLLVHPQKEKITAHQEKTVKVDSPLPSFKIPKMTAGAELITEIRSAEKENSLPAPPDTVAPVQEPEAPQPVAAVDTVKAPPAKPAEPVRQAKRHVRDDTLCNAQVLDTLFEGIRRVEVDVHFCDVNIRGAKGEKVALHARISENAGSFIMFGWRAIKKTEYRLKLEKQDTVLKVWMEHVSSGKRVNTVDINSGESVLDFEVPVKTNIVVDNSSGNLTASGLDNKSTLLRTAFGNIKAYQISSSLTLKSSSGNISLAKISGEIKTHSSFGNQVLEDITGNIDLHTSSGNCTITNLKGNADVRSSFGSQKLEGITGNITTSASSGHIEVKHVKGVIQAKSSFGWQVFEDVEGDLNAKASSGDIKVNGSKGMLKLGTSFGNINGKNVTLVSGGDFKTSSGNISMQLLNDIKDLSFDLSSSSGNLIVEKNNLKNVSDAKLMVGQGPILIRGVSSFGNQSYR